MIQVRVANPVNGKFCCFRDGYMQWMTLEEIKAAIANNEPVEEWK